MSIQFDPYEYIGVIIPGAAATFGGMMLFPDFANLFGKDGVQIGGLGVFVIVSFVAGHLVQAVGNLVESIVWKLRGGMPSNWVLRSDQTLIATNQRDRLNRMVSDRFGVSFETLSPSAWRGLTREIYALCRSNNRTNRIDSFNRTYGLMRGIFAACLLVGVTSLVVQPEQWKYAVLAFSASGLACARMMRFGIYYGRELMIEFLNLPADPLS